MDESEQLVANYLGHCGHEDVRYEPDGNTPPDFLVDGCVAVEVRRLNQNFDDGTGPRGLENTAIPLWARVRSVATSLGPAVAGESWFVFYSFSRPVPEWRMLRPKLKRFLQAFMIREYREECQLYLDRSFKVEIRRASKPFASFYVMGGHIDEQSGGWLLGEIVENLGLCIAEKTRKIAAFQHKYAEWWLILAHHIGYGLDELDQSMFRDQTRVDFGPFSRIILLDPRDPRRSFAL